MIRYCWIGLLALAVLLTGCDVGVGGGGILKPGQQVPSLKTKTLKDVGGDLSKITSYRYPDPRMYQYSFDQAILQKKPVILEFATPGHCTQCDQQLQMLTAILDQYQGKILILHMDQYYNPEAYSTFHVRGEPWTMVIGADQKLVTTMPGRLLYQELNPILKDLLKPKPKPVAKAKPVATTVPKGS
ncbi:MAG: thioredoxin family protein [Mariprofundales bacterium]|nr:thioredoxin family protein [Mariprofundales bacterium]